MPYVFLLCTGIVTAMLASLDRKHRTVYFVLLAAVMILFSGLRYKVGTDYESYELLYEEVVEDWASSEIGYVGLIRLMEMTGLGFSGAIFTMSLLTVAFAAVAITKFRCGVHSLYIFLTVPLFYLLSLNTIRQSLAAAIFMLATRYARDRDPRRFFSLLALAVGFHVSAILLAPTYFIANRAPTYKFLGLSLLAGVFFALNISIAVELLGLHPVYLEEKEGSALGQFVISLGSAIFLIHAVRAKRGKQMTDSPLVNYMSIAAGICFASLFTNVGAGFIVRMTTYFTWVIAILAPGYISRLPRGDRIAAFASMYVVASLYYLVTITRGEDINLVPYHTILSSAMVVHQTNP